MTQVPTISSTPFPSAPQFSGCVGDKEFTLFNSLATFAEAKNNCTIRGMVLGGIESVEEHSLLLDLADTFPGFASDANIWIGNFDLLNNKL